MTTDHPYKKASILRTKTGAGMPARILLFYGDEHKTVTIIKKFITDDLRPTYYVIRHFKVRGYHNRYLCSESLTIKEATLAVILNEVFL